MRPFPIAVLPLALFALAGCAKSTSFEYTNASTDAQLNAIGANMSEADGASRGDAGAAQVGEQIRSQAAAPPPPHP